MEEENTQVRIMKWNCRNKKWPHLHWRSDRNGDSNGHEISDRKRLGSCP